MSRLCRWGMHRPGPEKVFHQGRNFTRCSDCDVTLLSFGNSWREIPRGKRVVWRTRTPQDRFFHKAPNSDRARLRFDPLAPFKRRTAARRELSPGS